MFVTVKTEGNEEDNANNEVGAYVRIAPRVRATCPIERQKHQGSSSNEKKGADRVASPHPLFEAHPRIVGAFLWPIECEETERCDAM